MLSRSSEYAVRALSLLAVGGENQSLQSREIAARLDLPPQFLTKILRRLTTTGLVASQRGRAGGFRLGRSPHAISLLEVVQPFEEAQTEVVCLLGQAYCSDQDACPLHRPLTEIRTRFFDLLERTTLADVAVRAIRSCGGRSGAGLTESRGAASVLDGTIGGS
jgi:Rrf2 family protein